MLKALEDFIILIGFIGGGFIGVKLYKQVDSAYDPNRIESYAKAFFIGGLIGAAIFAVLGAFLKNFIVPLAVILLVIGVVLYFSDKTDTAENETSEENSAQGREENFQLQNDVDRDNFTPELNSAVSNTSVIKKVPVKKVNLKKNNLLPTPQTIVPQENYIPAVNQVVRESTPAKKFCAYCGAKLRPNSKFCGNCGKSTER